MADMPAAEVEIDEALLRRLLQEQHPDLAALPLARIAEGWDNVMWRLGDDLALRLPRREMGVLPLEHEQAWLPSLAPVLPLPIPAPVRIGVPAPGLGYAWPWSVVPWFDGQPALDAPPVDPAATAVVLGRFLAALHTEAPRGIPISADRGAPLRVRDARARQRIAAHPEPERAAITAAWEAALAAPDWDGPPLWVHGDLHPANMVVGPDGALVAVIDLGDIGAGDPAVDLSIAWMLLPHEHHSAFRAAAGTTRHPVDDAMWTRARGNALAHGLACLAHSDDNPRMALIGRRTLDAVLADQP